MYHRDIRVSNPEEDLVVEQTPAMYREMERTANAAPDSQFMRPPVRRPLERLPGSRVITTIHYCAQFFPPPLPGVASMRRL